MWRPLASPQVKSVRARAGGGGEGESCYRSPTCVKNKIKCEMEAVMLAYTRCLHPIRSRTKICDDNATPVNSVLRHTSHVTSHTSHVTRHTLRSSQNKVHKPRMHNACAITHTCPQLRVRVTHLSLTAAIKFAPLSSSRKNTSSTSSLSLQLRINTTPKTPNP